MSEGRTNGKGARRNRRAIWVHQSDNPLYQLLIGPGGPYPSKLDLVDAIYELDQSQEPSARTFASKESLRGFLNNLLSGQRDASPALARLLRELARQLVTDEKNRGIDRDLWRELDALLRDRAIKALPVNIPAGERLRRLAREATHISVYVPSADCTYERMRSHPLAPLICALLGFPDDEDWAELSRKRFTLVAGRNREMKLIVRLAIARSMGLDVQDGWPGYRLLRHWEPEDAAMLNEVGRVLSSHRRTGFGSRAFFSASDLLSVPTVSLEFAGASPNLVQFIGLQAPTTKPIEVPPEYRQIQFRTRVPLTFAWDELLTQISQGDLRFHAEREGHFQENEEKKEPPGATPDTL